MRGCESPLFTPAEYVTRDMSIDAGEPTMEGTMLRGDLYEPCGICEGCQELIKEEENGGMHVTQDRLH